MMKNLRESKGITLIALVITIIVLLILAGVAISMLSGENGIINRTNSAKTENEKEREEESVKLAVQAALATGYGQITSDEAMSMLRDELKKAGCTNSESIISLPNTAEMSNGEYEIDKYGNVTSKGTNSGDTGNDGEDPKDPVTPDEPEEVTIESLKESGEPVEGKTTLTDGNDDEITIPDGFKIAEDSATLVEEGIVVIAPDENGSEFVWVPVENAVYDSTNANAGKIPTSMTNGSKTGYTYTPMAIQVAGNYKGLLYDFDATGGAYLMYPDNENYQGTSSQCREPDTISSYDTDIAKPGSGLNKDKTFLEAIGLNAETFASEMTTNYDEMVESVKDNKGFYVGRYETSLSTTTGYAQSISGVKSANAGDENTYRWYGLYQKEKEYSENNSLTEVIGSSMIWGSQYDQMMIWMQKNDINVTASIGSDRNLGTTDANGNTISGTTGTTPTDKINNIYDIYGNVYERTLEADCTNTRVSRGGGYNISLSPSNRNSGNPQDTYPNLGSRLSLYVR